MIIFACRLLFYVFAKYNIDMAHASKHNGINKKTTDERKSSSKLLCFVLLLNNVLRVCVCSLVFYIAFAFYTLGGSDSFMGDARRLSEAGVRRSSGLFHHLYFYRSHTNNKIWAYYTNLDDYYD